MNAIVRKEVQGSCGVDHLGGCRSDRPRVNDRGDPGSGCRAIGLPKLLTNNPVVELEVHKIADHDHLVNKTVLARGMKVRDPHRPSNCAVALPQLDSAGAVVLLEEQFAVEI